MHNRNFAAKGAVCMDFYGTVFSFMALFESVGFIHARSSVCVIWIMRCVICGIISVSFCCGDCRHTADQLIDQWTM